MIGLAHKPATAKPHSHLPALRMSASRHRTRSLLPDSLTSAQQFVQRKASACSCGGGCPACAAKTDRYEHEADAAASQVMRKATPPTLSEIDEEPMQKSASELDVDTSYFKPALSGGDPLSFDLQQLFSSGFGRDFSAVRIHRDIVAQQSAKSIGARAYTFGRHVAFAAGEYAPDTYGGRHLIAHELAHVVQQGAAAPVNGSASATAAKRVQCQSPAVSSENVWGLQVTRAMCGCRQDIANGINRANTFGATYNSCDIAANPTSTDIEACFDAVHPGTMVAGSTSAGGNVKLPPPCIEPCECIENKATLVHETMHARHANTIARAQGPAFYQAWRNLAHDPDNRLDLLRPLFPSEVAAHEAQWDDGHDWAQDEVNSYRWERRFLQSTRRALRRICR